MKTGELNDWLGVVTNIGVIVGLILVAFEIRQNNIALEQEARVAEVEVYDGIRGAWQNWEYAIIENREVADIWMRGNAGESLDRLEEFRYKQLAREMYRLIAQNYRQYSTLLGEPADQYIQQLVATVAGRPRLKEVFNEQLNRQEFSQNVFNVRVKQLDPPEFRATEAQ